MLHRKHYALIIFVALSLLAVGVVFASQPAKIQLELIESPSTVRVGETATLGILRNGELAAFLVHEMMQVRRYHFVNGRVHLRPADRTYTEETYAPADPACHVVGRVVALLRKL